MILNKSNRTIFEDLGESLEVTLISSKTNYDHFNSKEKTAIYLNQSEYMEKSLLESIDTSICYLSDKRETSNKEEHNLDVDCY